MYQLCPSILSADFNRLGEQIKTLEKEGIEWLYAIVSKNNTLALEDLESNTLFYIERFMRKFIFENRENIKKKFRLKIKVIEILNFIIEKGSMRGYQLRESIL